MSGANEWTFANGIVLYFAAIFCAVVIVLCYSRIRAARKSRVYWSSLLQAQALTLMEIELVKMNLRNMRDGNNSHAS